ncbi:MAG: VWA domain-containing protein [Crenarchaeota archaeon]|nr:VWA domain-containing protein [Thermoproteota archaeon]
MSWNGISLSRRFDSEEASKRLAKELGTEPEFDAAWALGSAFYDVLTSDSPQLYDERELDGATPLKKVFDDVLKPVAEALRLMLDDEGKKMVTRAIIEELRRQLRNAPENQAYKNARGRCSKCRGRALGRAVSREMGRATKGSPSPSAVAGAAKAAAKIVRRAKYIPYVKDLARSFVKGRGKEVADIVFGDEIDEYRLELAKRVSMLATAIASTIREAIESSRRLGPGYMPARAAPIQEPSDLERALGESLALLATRHGKSMLASEELTALKTFAAEDVERSRQRVERLGLVIDCSGSMAGDEIVVATAIGIARIKIYRPKQVSVVFFNASSRVIKARTPLEVIKALAEVQPGGGTDVAGAVETALKEFRDADVIDVITDGRDDPDRAPADKRLSYVIVTEDGWRNWGWSKRKDACLVEYRGNTIRVVYPARTGFVEVRRKIGRDLGKEPAPA